MNRPKALGRLIGAFKTVTTKEINRLRRSPGSTVWQRDFWDQIIWDAAEMQAARNYIALNAANWSP